jgi:CRISPR-associated endonuclease Cas3-HD
MSTKGSPLFAHTLGPDLAAWEPLLDHLRRTARGTDGLGGAAAFAAAFAAAPWGEALGWWHDLGKASAEFQRYLRISTGADQRDTHIEASAECANSPPPRQHRDLAPSARVDHSTYGAQHAWRSVRGSLRPVLAACVAGHHAGLPDDAELRDRLDKPVPAATPPIEALAPPPPSHPAFLPVPTAADNVRKAAAFRLAFAGRMLFSCLVDADFLATEAFLDPGRSAARVQRERAVSMKTLSQQLRRSLDVIEGAARSSTPINAIRAEIRTASVAKSALPPGLFTLTVPTGGGKTLTGLDFALRHAAAHGLRRVIFAVPFTSIIEQTARVYRRALASDGLGDPVLEHHSNLDPGPNDGQNAWSRLAAENWDAPIVVTTTVQLYESLFANQPSKCRKLHRIARSVLILDEAQAIPVHLLEPTLAALRELVEVYGCSVVVCTATQPAVGRRGGAFPIGLDLRPDRELAPDPPAVFASIQRTRVERDPGPPWSNEDLAGRLAEHESALAIVRLKRDASEAFRCLAEVLDESEEMSLRHRSTFHLSTAMCGQHRSLVLGIIRNRLERGLPCRVVSTSLIEAGVDIDFPIVYRAMAGLDSIAQAAGRCNREGRQPGLGRVVVFEPQTPYPARMPSLQLAAQCAERAIATHDDPLSPGAIDAYFRDFFWLRTDEHDARGIMRLFQLGSDGMPVLEYRTAAERYRLIDDQTTPVVVPFGRGRRLIEDLHSLRTPADREHRRRLQRYTVGVWDHTLRALEDAGVVVEPDPDRARGIRVLQAARGYSMLTGLEADPLQHDSDDLII